MSESTIHQLSLLEVPPFAGGPARPPRGRRVRPVSLASLALPLRAADEVSPEVLPSAVIPSVAAPAAAEADAPVSAPIDPRRVAIDEALAQLRARLQANSISPLPTDDTMRDPPAPEELPARSSGSADAAPADERVFVFRQRPKPAERTALVSLLARRLEGCVLRSGRFEAAAGEDHLFGRVDKETVTVAFTGASARGRWLATVQQIADENDLAEPE